MSQVTSQSSSTSGTEVVKVFKPSISSIREHIARLRADRVLDQFAKRFTEDNYFPDGGDDLLFAMLTWLPQWPSDTGIVILDGEGASVASYLKGNDWGVIEHTISFVQRDDGTYSAPGSTQTYHTESLFWVLCSQIPSTSEIGRYGDDSSVESRITTLRGQISRASRTEHALLFEALMADAHVSKSGSPDIKVNPYVPYRTFLRRDGSPALWALHDVNPQLPVARLEDLLLSLPLSDDQEAELLDDATLSESFYEALQVSRYEWEHHRAIDGLRHTRVYDEQTDALARALADRLLKARLGRRLVITEYGGSQYRPTGPEDNPIILVHGDRGLYGRGDKELPRVRPVGKDTDSFYLAIVAQLQAHELRALGVEHNQDVSGLRAAIANLAIEDNGGWFALDGVSDGSIGLLPEWFRQASLDEKLAWKDAMQSYSQTMLEAQAPDLIEMSTYGDRRVLRNYVREKLRDRLSVDHGLELNPDGISIVTRHASTELSFPIDTEYGWVDPSTPIEVVITTQTRDLIDLCLANLSITDLNFLLTGQAFDSNRRLISQLSSTYIFSLVRDLDVGKSYSEFLNTRLMTSPEGQWCKERFACAMQAQMRIDALEAKIAGDFMDGVNWPAGHEDRGYKWVQAILDHPGDDQARARVEGQRIVVEKIFINRVPLDELLIIRPANSDYSSPIVVYIPHAPDGRCFSVISRLIDLRPMLQDPVCRDHVVSLAAPEYRERIRDMLISHWHTIGIETMPCKQDFLEASYRTKVKRVVSAANQQTTTTSEKNWESAWEIIRSVGEVVLTFTPFKVALPIAALRSLYAITQGVRKTENGEEDASLHFLEAALFLLDALPSPSPKIKTLKVRGSSVSDLSQATALSHAPDGLSLRTDGIFSGIHETSHQGAPSRFYVNEAGKTYPVRYDRDYATWRLIDPRRPDAYYQTPIRFEGGQWKHANVGLLGGGRKAAKVATPGTSGGAGASGGPKRYTLDTSKLEKDKVFKKADGHIQDRLAKSVQDVKDDFERRGGGKFHGYTPKGETEKVFTLDLTGMPNSTGRGAWRMFLKEKKVQSEVDGKTVWVVEEGVLELYKIVDKH